MIRKKKGERGVHEGHCGLFLFFNFKHSIFVMRNYKIILAFFIMWPEVDQKEIAFDSTD